MAWRAASGRPAMIASWMAACSARVTAMTDDTVLPGRVRATMMVSRIWSDRKLTTRAIWSLPAARATARWKSRSASTPAESPSTSRSMWRKASVMAAMPSAVRRAAASPAVWISRSARSSKRLRKVVPSCSASASKRRTPVPWRRTTKAPTPWRDCTSPSARRRETASRTTLRLTP
ncbi:hypothetical protein CR165_11665 [Pseudoroseomonas aestuarii]|uniref:Uncharacterized protein n=1 Tax=Teichococcus aestuarii TaxID=568898 RepID=A0A2U1V4E3_9PROT|nr:hypothetical protein CR165_11665 [Pseudoroseomonas aestuarii]